MSMTLASLLLFWYLDLTAHDVIGYRLSEFAIINDDDPTEFAVEKKLVLSDKEGRKLNLRLNYL